MKVLENENVIMCDVDETLILHRGSHPGVSPFIPEPNCIFIYDERIDRTIVVEPYYPHIDIVLQSRSRGRLIIVWSASGYEWAKMVIEALGIQDAVDIVMTKPSIYLDDIDANKFMNRVYISPKKEA